MVLVLSAISGCDASSDSGGTIEIQAIAEDFLGDQVAVIDITVGSASKPALAVDRVVWPNPHYQLVTVAAPCDPADNPYFARAELKGLYDAVPPDIGAYGEAAPAGSVPLIGAVPEEIEIMCVAGKTFSYRFVVSSFHYQSSLVIDASVEAGPAPVGDALWRVVATDETARTELFEARITSAFWGDGHGGFAYQAPCPLLGDPPASLSVSIELLGLYEAPLPLVGRPGDPIPDGGLEAWLPGPLARPLSCAADTDVYVALPLTVARADRSGSDLNLMAEFAGVVCRAGWTCSNETGALDFACRAPGDAAPALYLDDLEVRCADGTVTPVDPSTTAPESQTLGEVVWTSWRVPVSPALALAPGCALAARGTASTWERAHVESDPSSPFISALIPGAWMDNGVIPEGAAYPIVTWSIPLGDACLPQTLDFGGPVTVVYSEADALGTTFEHDSLVP